MRTLNLRFAVGLLVVLILLGIGTYFLHHYQYTRIADDIAGQSRSARVAGESADAIRLAYHYLQFRPDDAALLEELGGWLEEKATTRRQIANVVNLLDRSLQLQPTRNDLRRKVVSLNLKIGRWGECLDHLDRLLPDSPDDPELLAAFGVCKEAIGKPAEAAEALEKAWNLDQKRVASALDYAQLLQRHLGRPDDARKILEQAAQLNPDHAGVRLGLARFFRATGKLSEAESAAKEAVRLAPKDASTLITAAEIFQAAGRLSLARSTLQEAVALNPDDTRVVCSLAWLLLYDGKIDQAIEHLRAAIRDKPANADVLTLLGDILALDGRLDALEQVVADLQRVRRSAPERGWNADYLQARLWMRRGDWPKATAMLEQLRLSAAKNPNLAKQANFLLALCYDQYGDRAKEQECYRRILEADSQAGYFRLEYARTLARAGQHAEAAKEFRQAIQRSDLPPRTMVEVLTEIIDRAERNGAGTSIRELEKSLATVRADDAAFYQILAKVELGRLQNRAVESLNLATQYLNKHPNQSAMIIARLRLLDHVHGVDRARSALQEAEKRMGDLADWRLVRIRMLVPRYQPSDRDQLLALADKMERLTPEDRLAIHSELLLASQSTGDDPLIQEVLTRFRTARPDHLPVRAIALTRALAANDEASIQQLLTEIKAIEGENGFTQRLFQAERLVGRCAIDPSAISSARASLHELGKEMPGHPMVEFFLGRVAELADEPGQALRHYTTALNHNLLDQPIDEQFLALARQDPSQRRCRVLMEESPLADRARFDHDRCVIAALLSTPAASLRPALADRILRGNAAASPAYLVWFAKQCQNLGLARHAALALARATDKAPLSDEAWSARIGYYAQRQDVAQVQELVVEAKKRIPANESAIILTKCLERAGLPTDAVRDMRVNLGVQATPVRANRSSIHNLLQTGRIDEARQQLQSLVDQADTNVEDKVWARRTLAVNLTLAPSLAAFHLSLKLLEDNRQGGEWSMEDRRALTQVLAAQKSRIIDGMPASQKAIQLLNEMTGQSGHQPDDFILLARLYRSQGNSAEYQRVMGQLASQFGHHPLALVFMAQEALRCGDWTTADRLVTELETLDRQNLEVLVLRASLMVLTGRGPEAVSMFEKFIAAATSPAMRSACELRCGHAAWEILTNYPQSTQPTAVSLLRQAAIRWYQQGMGRDPQALLRLLTLLCQDGRTGVAFELLQHRDVRTQLSTDACAAGALTILRNGHPSPQQIQAVERQISELVRQNPGSTAMMLMQADLFGLTDREPEAVAIYRRVLDREPGNVMALNNLAWTLSYDPGKMGEAARLIEDAIDRTGPLDELLDTRARILFAQGRREEGLRDLIDAAVTAPSATRFFYLAMMYRQADQPQHAQAALNRAKEFGLTVKDVHPRDAGLLQEVLSRN